MEQLSKEEIKFIDNYLKNSGVTFLDVRLEMTDHVASEIEQRMSNGDARGFYLVFKDYMRVNKKLLLKSVRRYRWQADRKVLRMVFRNLFYPANLFIFGILIAFQFGFSINPETDRVFYPLFYLVLAGILLVPYLLVGRKNFVSLNSLSILFFVFIYFIKLILDLANLDQLNNIWINSGLVLINLAVIKTTYELISFYKKHYKLS